MIDVGKWKQNNDVPAFISAKTLDIQSQFVKFRINVLNDTVTFLLQKSDEPKTICSWQAILVLG